MSNRRKINRAVRRSAEAKNEHNDSANRKVMKQAGQCNCRYCPPWKNDNKVARVSKRSTKKPRYKDKR